jgi:GT2 family glycosyltransferase
LSSSPELCAVVLSYRNEDTILDAVDSLRSQDEPVEIVVSHSGGGATPELLAGRGVKCVATADRRLPGAARNAGVAATSAPFVSFLAGDCLATPGWAAARLARHRAGARAVASSLAPADEGLIARAAWIFQHSARLPLEQPVPASLHGVSYARSDLEAHGPFREDVLVGEDTELNDLLVAAGVEIAWAPEVVTLHRYPTGPVEMLRDAWARGRRASEYSGPAVTSNLVITTAKALPMSLQRARSARPGPSTAELGAALPLITACWAAKLSATALR